jgi:Zn-dependent protease with chaperone function
MPLTVFLASAALVFFVVGSLVLALPWCGLVHLVERMPASSRPSPARYGMLLIAPVAGLLVAVAIALGPWDSGIGKAIHDGCLHHISHWNLPPAIAGIVGAAIALTLGRLIWSYGVRRAAIRTEAAALPADQVDRWRVVSGAVLRLTGFPAPRLVAVGSPAGICALRGGFHPALLIDRNLLAALDDEELVAAVCHELAHARRWDLVVGPLLHLCFCLLSFFPAARLCYARYLEHRELAADAWAVNRTRQPLALASAIAKASRAAGGQPNAEARVHRLLSGPSQQSADERPLAAAWALALLVLALVAFAVPNLEHWHRVLESFGKDLLLATGVLN